MTSLRSLAARVLPLHRLARRALRGRALVLALHRVDDDYAGDGLTLAAAEFDAHCRILSEHFDVVPLLEIVQRLERGEPLDGQVAISFDDGYLDNYEIAAPLLERYGLPATFFVTTGFIETEVVAPWDEQLATPPRWMSWQQVRDLHARGFSIGGHTVDHLDLGRVGEDVAREQLGASRQALSQRLGEAPELFAYPFGRADSIDETNRALVRETGFRCCASCFGGLVETGSDPFALPRVALSSWYADTDRFALDLALGRL